MREFSYIVTDPAGIHARPAGELVKETAKYKSEITLVKKNRTADAKRIFAVMGLAVKHGEPITVRVEGEDEDNAVRQIELYFKSHL